MIPAEMAMVAAVLTVLAANASSVGDIGNDSSTGAAARESDNAVNGTVKSSGRCLSCLFKGVHMFHGRHHHREGYESPPPPPPPPPATTVIHTDSCPQTDLSSITNYFSTIENRITLITNKINLIDNLQESVRHIVERVDDRSYIERVVQNSYNNIKETIRSDFTAIRERMEKVETVIYKNSCSSSGRGDTALLESSINLLATKLETLLELHRETKTSMASIFETIVQKIDQKSQISLGMNPSGGAVTCSDSPGIAKIKKSSDLILQAIKAAVQTISQEVISVKTEVRSVSSKSTTSSQNVMFSSDFDAKSLFDKLNRIQLDLFTLKTDVSSLKLSLISQTGLVQRQSTTQFDNDLMKQVIITTSTNGATSTTSTQGSRTLKDSS